LWGFSILERMIFMSTDRKENPSRRERVMPREAGASTANRKSGPALVSTPASTPEADIRPRVPQIISRLYSASALYPGEDGDTFEQLLDELAIALGPADVIEWLLVADLRSVIFDERRYRCALALFLSPGKLIEPELSEMAVEAEVISATRNLLFQRQQYVPEEEHDGLFGKILKEVVQSRESKCTLEENNAAELSRRHVAQSFRECAAEIEMLHKLINQTQRRRYEILSQLSALRALQYARPSTPAQIEDADYCETAVDETS